MVTGSTYTNKGIHSAHPPHQRRGEKGISGGHPGSARWLGTAQMAPNGNVEHKHARCQEGRQVPDGRHLLLRLRSECVRRGNDDGAHNAQRQAPHLPPSQLLPAKESPAGQNQRRSAHKKKAVGEAGGVDAINLAKYQTRRESGTGGEADNGIGDTTHP